MSDIQSKPSRSLWSSRFAFIMVAAGAAVGLGNIWKFPYMAGSNGGGVFVIAYLFFIALIGIPAMIAELLIGRRGRQNPVNCLATLAKQSNASSKWQGLGWLGALTLILVLAFYSVVAGWSIAYLAYAFKGLFVNATPESIVAIWTNLLASPLELTQWHTIFICLTMLVVALGVNAGIERASKWMMPGLFLTLIALVIYAAIEGDFRSGLSFMFSFRPEELTSRAVIDALGQAFFSLATGAGCILIYGSYLSKETDLVKTVIIISLLDVLVAIFSGLAIFPIVFSHNLAPESGPGLMFHVLPIAFSHMPGSQVVGSLFFILLLFAAWTSSISMAEPLVAMLNERWQITRKRGAFLIGALAWTLGLASVFSFNIWKNVKIMGKWDIFQVLTDLPINILLPIGAFLFCIFAGWIMPDTDSEDEFDGNSLSVYLAWRFAIRYLAPIGIFIVFIANFF
ncbi:MAG: sodium-dependent transporter [Candidatus Berkiella sp.]